MSDIQKDFEQKCQKLIKYMSHSENVFCGLSLILSGRFDDPAVQETRRLGSCPGIKLPDNPRDLAHQANKSSFQTKKHLILSNC